jgi:hypothetical protein
MNLEGKVVDELRKWSVAFGMEKAFISSSLNRPKNKTIYQIANVEEDDKRYVEAKIQLEERLNKDGVDSPKTNSKLRTQIGHVPRNCGYIHSNIHEEPVTSAERQFMRTVCEEMTGMCFKSSSQNAWAGVSLPIKKRDPAFRMRCIQSFFNDVKWPICKFEPNRLQEFTWKFLQEGPFFIGFEGLSRRQADSFGKSREAMDAYGNIVDAGNQLELHGHKLQTCRYREPQMLDGRANIPFAILAQGDLNYQNKTFPFLFKHKGVEHTRAKLINFDKQAAMKWPSSEIEPWDAMLDVPAMEKHVHTELTRIAAEEFDKHLGPWNCSWLFINAVGLSASGREGIFNCTHQLRQVQYHANLGTGNRSGWFFVVPTGRKAMLSALVEALSVLIPEWKWNVQELNSGSRIRALNSVDDTRLRGILRKDRERIVGKTLQVQGMELSFEEGTGFLKVNYNMPSLGQCDPRKDMSSFFSNILVSEGGLKHGDYWVRTGNVTKSVPVGVGIMARLLEYNLGGEALKYWEYVERMLWDNFKMKWYQAWPTSRLHLRNLLDAVHEEVSVLDAWEMMLNLDPTMIYKGFPLDEMDPALLEKMFIHIDQERFKQLTQGLLPLDSEPGKLSEDAHDLKVQYPFEYLGQYREQILDYIKTQLDILDRAPSSNYVPDELVKRSPHVPAEIYDEFKKDAA